MGSVLPPFPPSSPVLPLPLFVTEGVVVCVVCSEGTQKEEE